MKSGTKKILWGIAAAVLLFLVLAASAVAYLYLNPSRIKDVVAQAASGFSGYEVRIDTLDWSAKPLRLKVGGIQAASGGDPGATSELTIRTLDVGMHLEGGFGKRTLVIERAGIKGVNLALEGVPVFPETGAPRADEPSLAARAAAGLMSRLLFRDVRIARAELQEARVTVKAGAAIFRLERIYASLTAERNLRASCEARIEHPESHLRLDLPLVNAEAGLIDGSETVKGRLSMVNGTLKHPEGTVQGFSLECSAQFHPDSRRIRMDALDLHLPDLRPFLPFPFQHPVEAVVLASGTALPQEQRMEDGILRVNLKSPPAAFHIETGINMSWGTILEGALEGINSRFRPADWIPLLPLEYRDVLSGIDVSGILSLSGGVEASLDGRGLLFAPDLSLHFEENRISLSAPPLKAQTRLSGGLRVFGEWPELLVSADIKASELAMEHPAARILPSQASFRLTGSPSEIHLQKADMKVPGIHLTLAGNPLLIRDMRVRADKGVLNPFISAGEIPEIRVEAEGVGPFFIEAGIRNEKTTLSVHGQETGLASLLSADGLPFHGWNMKGNDSVHLLAETGDFGQWKFSARLDFEALSFENARLDAFAEGLGLSLGADGITGKGGPVLLESLNLRASSGEALVGPFYINLESHPFSVKARTEMDLAPLRLLDSSLEIGIQDLVLIRVLGSLERAGAAFRGGLDLSVPPFRLEPAFQLFAVEPFGMKMPILKSMSVNGEASADLRLKTDADGFFVTGEARMREGGLSIGEPAFALEDASVSIPILYGTVFDHQGDQPLKGRLKVGNLRIPFIPEQSLALDLEALPNRIRVPGHTRFAIPGGELLLGPLDITHDIDKGIGLESSLHLEDVDLGPLLETIWRDAPDGRLKGSLAPIRYRNGMITSQGDLEAWVFGGRVTVENIGASGLFSSTPVFGLDAGWKGLDLEQMTSGTAFGKITGIIDGRLEGFELAYGQPQRFFLLMETVQQKGVDQRISVRAVDNIAQIGGGGSPFVGMAGYFTSLFREFPYERIGVRAVLEADVFRINGTIMEGGKEYFIKKSGFSGVNVVNQNPDNKIGFKDMVKRIQRVAAPHGGPVIQ